MHYSEDYKTATFSCGKAESRTLATDWS